MASRNVPRIRMRLLAGVLCLGLLPRHAAADQAGAVFPMDRTIARAALIRVAADNGAQATPEPGKNLDPQPSKPFLKTRRGILFVSLVALAVGFTVYSTSNDQVQSPIR